MGETSFCLGEEGRVTTHTVSEDETGRSEETVRHEEADPGSEMTSQN